MRFGSILAGDPALSTHVMQITRDDAGSPEAVSPIEAYGGGEGRHRASNERTGA